mgnify:CR=1 FL=1
MLVYFLIFVFTIGCLSLLHFTLLALWENGNVNVRSQLLSVLLTMNPSL